MQLKNNKIILRDMIENDIDDIIYWNTIETEWMLWDAPWEHSGEDLYDWQQYRITKQKQIKEFKDHSMIRSRFEICINNESKTHIGYISSYHINEEYKIDEHGSFTAIGMDICSTSYRRKGYGSSSYQLYIQYLQEQGIHHIYTQTWSGNIPLIKMVEKLGFKECNRYEKIRQVRGELYDGLTFVLK